MAMPRSSQSLYGQPEAFTFADYLAQERKAENRHEYLDGKVYAMAGETLEHSTICTNVSGELYAQLKGKPCRLLSPNMKVLSGIFSPGQAKGLFSYPDIAVVCGEPKFHDERRDVLLNPSLIVEALSPSTEMFDRGHKFLRYRTFLDSLQNYVLISTSTPMVELFQRQPGGLWLYSDATGLDASINLPAINCTLALADVFGRIEFPVESLQPFHITTEGTANV